MAVLLCLLTWGSVCPHDAARSLQPCTLGSGAPHNLEFGGQGRAGEQRVPRAAQPPVLDSCRRLRDHIEAAGALQHTQAVTC